MGLRQKLMLVFGGMLVFIGVISGLTIVQIDQLGKAVNVVLQENYLSVAACQDMKESIERIDSGILFILAGNKREGDRLIRRYTDEFRSALDRELGNITLPGERERAERIRVNFDEYMKDVSRITRSDVSLSTRKAIYFSTVLPLFHTIKNLAQEILIINQTNMSEASRKSRNLASAAHTRMVAVLVLFFFLAVLFSYLARRWILHPILRLIESTNDICNGNLDLVIETRSRDEIGRLSESFNDMASALRKTRKSDLINLIRTRRAVEEVFKTLPSAIAVLDPEGRVEVSTETAERFFGLVPGVMADSLDFDWLNRLVRKGLVEGRIVESDTPDEVIQRFYGNREYFFQPVAVPILDGQGNQEPTGIVLILNDITQLHEQRELKRGVLSTVSHQLKTPLTSLRMSLHLLLEERVGSLTESQSELLVTARDDSERLLEILDDLLDLNRIESGGDMMNFAPVSPVDMACDAVESFLPEARDRSVSVFSDLEQDLPRVLADPEKIRHVFSNLLTNALRFTGPGGTIRIRALVTERELEFFVEDTGTGIPKESIDRLFDPFYRVPGQNDKSGVGLGLSIVKEIIQAHGGVVHVKSTVGVGSTFSFTLPLSPEENSIKQ